MCDDRAKYAKVEEMSNDATTGPTDTTDVKNKERIAGIMREENAYGREGEGGRKIGGR